MPDETPKALVVERKEDGVTFGVSARRYSYLLESGDFKDAGSTDLSVDAVPLHEGLPLPKVEALQKNGLDTVGEVRALEPYELEDLEGIGEKSAQEILEALRKA